MHRLWKLNGDKGKSAASTSSGKYSKSLFGASLNGRDDEKIKRITDQTIQENIRTTEKMNQLRLKMELANARKKLKSIKFPMKKMPSVEIVKRVEIEEQEGLEKPVPKEPFIDKVIQRQMKQERFLSAESKLKIKENLTRNRSFKTILSPPALASSSFFNDNPMEFCFSGSTGDVISPSNKLGRSLSFQSNYVFNRTDSNIEHGASAVEAATISNSTPIIQEYVAPICEPGPRREVKKPAYSTSMQDLLLKGFLTKSSGEFSNFASKSPRECAFEEKPNAGQEINEYFILPKLLIDAGKDDKQPSSESLVEFYDNLTSSSSSLVSKLNDYGCFPSFHQPSANRFYHSDLDLNAQLGQLNDRFKNKLSISNQDINTSGGNFGGDSDWSRSNLLLLSAINQTKDEPANENIDVNYDKFLNDLLNTDYGSAIPVESDKDEASGVTPKPYPKDSELIDLFGNDLDSTLLKKTTARRIPQMKKPSEKLKSFGSNPTLLGHHMSTHDSSNLAATTTTSTTTVHIPQLSNRLDAIPTKYRRGKLRNFIAFWV